jgi:hypothetical protein
MLPGNVFCMEIPDNCQVEVVLPKHVDTKIEANKIHYKSLHPVQLDVVAKKWDYDDTSFTFSSGHWGPSLMDATCRAFGAQPASPRVELAKVNLF